jgi:sec-independent protein translocase protein TatB
MAGQWIGKIRRMAAEFQGQFQEAMREAEMADLKKQVDELAESTRDVTQFDPIGSMQESLDDAFKDKPSETPLPESSGDAALPAPADLPGPSPAPSHETAETPPTPLPSPESPVHDDAGDAVPPPPKAAAGGHSA